MVAEDLERGFGVGVEGGLELELIDSDLCVELLHDTDQVVQTDSFSGNDTLDLVELSQMGGV